MKVLVLGGTGAMGMHLVQILANNGVETVVTSRSLRASEGGVRYVQGNARKMDFLQTLLQEHWDAIVDFMLYSTTDFEERVDLFLNATSHYIYLSSSRVYADSESPIVETSSRLLDVSQDEKFLGTDEYSLSKARQENILKQSGRFNWTIIRPYITYSETRLQLGVLEKEEWLYRALHGKIIVFSSDIISKVTTMTYGRDVSNALANVIENVGATGEVFHITTESSVTWDQVLTIYLDVLEKHLGRRPKVLLQDLGKFMECKPAKYQIFYDRLFDRRFNNSKINQCVDISNFVQAETGLESCLKQFLDKPKFKKINWITEAIKDRQVNEYTP